MRYSNSIRSLCHPRGNDVEFVLAHPVSKSRRIALGIYEIIRLHTETLQWERERAAHSLVMQGQRQNMHVTEYPPETGQYKICPKIASNKNLGATVSKAAFETTLKYNN